jgi:formylglycine-generating enzyme required for sulfatase activity
VADYELVQLLGRGGYGEVWKALGPGGFAVALKFIRLGDRAGAVELRSLELMKDIRHPNLLGVFGAWQREPFLILAIELADRSLNDRLHEATREGLPGIPPAELLEYMNEAAKGIDHLNGLGVQHRDVKPHNLLLVGGGVRVADFGLAKLQDRTVTSNTGALTPAYAPPEAFEGRTSSASDQYSLAVTYCQLRGGRLPFAGNLMQVMNGHLTCRPNLTMLPEGERPVVARALAKVPEERWPSCRAFVAAVAADAGRPRPPASRRPAPGPDRGERKHCPSGGDRPPVPQVGQPPVRTPRPAGLPREVTNSLGMRLVLIPPGKFTMGAPEDERDRCEDEGQHAVTITRPFYLGVYPVTHAEFERVMGTNPSWFSGLNGGKDRVAGLDTSRFPVEMVSWVDAAKFCRALSAVRAEKRAAHTYRLPTEAEWEYACREGGVSVTPFHFGSSLSSRQANFDGRKPYGGAPPGRCLGRTTAVGTYPANGLGLHDLHGNVWEWCADWYGADSDSPRPARNSQAPEGKDRRVLRGGSWDGAGRFCRAAFRYGHAPGDRSKTFGFRVVLVPGLRAP